MERRRLEEPLLYWAKERESIRRKKAAGLLSPWTDDPILQRYRFCNLRRRDDRVSQWLIRSVFTQQALFSPWSFIQFTALARWVNWPPTLAVLREQGLWPAWELDLERIGRCIDERCTTGEKAWTGAYMVRAAPKRQYGDIPKGAFVARVVVGQGLERVREPLLRTLETSQLRGATEALCAAMNWGTFMAGQVTADWSYTSLLSWAPDLLTWAPQGPGSRRGFNRLLGRLLSQRIAEDEWLDQLQRWRSALIAVLGPEYESLTLMDVQNSLCETDKYLRVKYGEGRPRSTYKPETAY